MSEQIVAPRLIRCSVCLKAIAEGTTAWRYRCAGCSMIVYRFAHLHCFKPDQ